MTGPELDYDEDDWGREEPDTPDRLTELATQLAELAGLTVHPASETPRNAGAYVQFSCLNCGIPMGAMALNTAEVAAMPMQHVCKASVMGDVANVAVGAEIRSGS